MIHRILTGDGSDSCYVCGTAVDNGWSDTGDTYADTAPTFDRIPCTGPSTEHPGYYIPMGDDEPYRETCAAHPYAD